MMKIISKIIFIYFIYLQVLSIYVGYEIEEVKIFKFSLFQLGILPALALVFFELFKYFKKSNVDPNKFVIKLIAYYSLYQVLILLPISYFESDIAIYNLFRNLMQRLFFLLIPFIYWFVLPNYKYIKTPINWVAYSSILLLILSFYNYVNGIYTVTNTGELRLVAGVAAMLFVFTLVTSFSLFSRNKNNLILISVALIGLVFVNHRSAYLMLGILFFLSIIISMVNTKRIKFKFSKVVVSVIIIILLVIPLSQIPLIKENFTGRIASSFDTTDPNALDRMMRWGLSFSYFLDNPINGSKLENKYYADDEMLKEFYEPHNFVFEILSTQGIVGFIFISLILFYILIVGYRNKNDNITYQMFLVVIFYILYSLVNVTILNSWNILILVFSSAVILYRNKLQLNNDKNVMKTIHK
jgi:O-antigen ligase